jgi:diguanylate cyclase (GGDEF)-like protein
MPDLDLATPDGADHAVVPADRDVLRAVARLAALATAAFDPDDALHALCRAATDLLDVDGVGAMGVVDGRSSRGRARYVHADTGVDTLERLQEALQVGPCRDAIDAGEVVAHDDVRAVGRRDPEFADAMVESGMAAVMAVPLLARGRAWGTLDLYRRASGPWLAAEVDTARLLADVAVSYLVMASDRDAAQAAQQEIEHRSMHDSLTGLPNRALFYDRVEHELAAAARHGTALAVAFIDLDHFKHINDSAGHAAGDEVLVDVARRLGGALRAQDTLARLAGDEFVALLADLPADRARRTEVLTTVALRLRQVLKDPVTTGTVPVLVTASIGIAVCAPGRPTTAAALVHEADLAMYAAKGTRDAVVVHEEG